MSSELSRTIQKLYLESYFGLRWPLWFHDRLLSLIITFSFYQSCFLLSLLFYVFPELQVTVLVFVLVLHNNNDHHLDYDCLHFRLRQSMQLLGTTDCQITSVGEDRNQLLEHHEHQNSKSLQMLLRKALGECGGNCCCQTWFLQAELCLCLHCWCFGHEVILNLKATRSIPLPT